MCENFYTSQIRTNIIQTKSAALHGGKQGIQESPLCLFMACRCHGIESSTRTIQYNPWSGCRVPFLVLINPPRPLNSPYPSA